MGQPINVTATRVGDVLMFDTDRSITGQDGAVYSSADEAGRGDRFPDQLAARLFAADDSIDHVFVASNQVVVRSSADWDDTRAGAAKAVIEDFFLFYPAASG